jgi:hypothetical protein
MRHQLALLVSLSVAGGCSSSARPTAVPSSAPASSASPSSGGASTIRWSANAPEALREVRVVRVPNAPVELVDLRLQGSGESDVRVTVENRSNQPVTFIGYLLMFPVCAKLEHAPARWLKYGDRSVLDPRDIRSSSEPPVLPGARAELTLTRDVLQLFQRTIESKCPGRGPPELVLSKVAFGDGTGWESYGTSSGYAGKAWKIRTH